MQGYWKHQSRYKEKKNILVTFRGNIGLEDCTCISFFARSVSIPYHTSNVSLLALVFLSFCLFGIKCLAHGHVNETEFPVDSECDNVPLIWVYCLQKHFCQKRRGRFAPYIKQSELNEFPVGLSTIRNVACPPVNANGGPTVVRSLIFPS